MMWGIQQISLFSILNVIQVEEILIICNTIAPLLKENVMSSVEISCMHKSHEIK